MNTVPQYGISPGKSQRSWVGKIALSTTAPTTVNLETVTPGKTLVLTDIELSYDATSNLDTRIQSAGQDIFRSIPPTRMPGITSPPEAQSGQLVTLLFPQAPTPINALFNIQGYELDVAA